ncbi:hypothetical protein O181_114283 [Austropuccinia psidii MF-1]|uniref:Uncharacterized protein n=1 Tax=Austropuccinia psidii MF-1 TaxID=1389203 RepID=A0A9Q3K448_9BASI|nr:hypothetical protein [Austropuccinia psidii MF-1]
MPEDLESDVDPLLLSTCTLNPLARKFVPEALNLNAHPPTSATTTLPAYSPPFSPISEFDPTSPCCTKHSLQAKFLYFFELFHDKMANLKQLIEEFFHKFARNVTENHSHKAFVFVVCTMLHWYNQMER